MMKSDSFVTNPPQTHHWLTEKGTQQKATDALIPREYIITVKVLERDEEINL